MNIVDEYIKFLNEGKPGFDKYPKGWTKKSVKKAGKTLAKHVGKESPKKKGFFEKCVEKMRGNIDDPEAYCAALKSEAHGSTYWRGKGKTEKEAERASKAHKNV